VVLDHHARIPLRWQIETSIRDSIRAERLPSGSSLPPSRVLAADLGVSFGFHLCRGNQLSRWLVSGGYDAIAAPVFGAVKADRLLLEYDDERSGTFDVLRLVPAGTVVVLGLVTTKRPLIEPLEQIKARLGEARSVVDAERLALSPQRGFATSAGGNAITAQAQRAKLALLVRAARDFLPA
jgi:methionine synthase II (cobalamin-independent)